VVARDQKHTLLILVEVVVQVDIGPMFLDRILVAEILLRLQ